MAKYKTIIGALVRDYIPIKSRKWIRKDDNPWRVPKSEKDAIWEKWIPQDYENQVPRTPTTLLELDQDD